MFPSIRLFPSTSSGAERPETPSLTQAAVLAFLLTTPIFGGALETPGAPSSECLFPWIPPSSEESWRTLRDMERCAALPGLSSSRRADAFIQQAGIRSLLGDQAGAEETLKKALLSRPGDPEASFLLAEILRDRPEQALRHAERAARTAASPRRRSAAYRLAGEIRLDLGDKAGARASLSRALELAGDDLDALRAMAWINRAEAGPASAYALRACGAAKASPLWRRVAAYRLCAQILIDIKDYPGAVANLGRALDMEPDDVSAMRLLLQIKRQWPQAKLPPPGETPAGARAEEDPAPLLALDPEDLEALRALVAIKRAENKLPEAVSYAERFAAAVRKAPPWQHADAYRLNARMWLELRKPERAVSSLLRAEELDFQSIANERSFSGLEDHPNNAEVLGIYQFLIDARRELGDPAGAQASLERALQLLPHDLNIMQLMVELKLSQRKPAEALLYAERLLQDCEKTTPADTVKTLVKTLPSFLFIMAAEKSDVDRKEPITGFYLKDARIAEKASRTIEKDRRMALRTMVQVQLALGRPREALAYVGRLLKASKNAPPSELAEVLREKNRIQGELKNEAGRAAKPWPRS